MSVELNKIPPRLQSGGNSKGINRQNKDSNLSYVDSQIFQRRIEKLLNRIDKKLNPIEARMIECANTGIMPAPEMAQAYHRLMKRWFWVLNIAKGGK